MNIQNLIKNKFENKKILILGLGREGLSTYNFLKKYLPKQRIDIADEKPLEKLDSKFQEKFHKDKQDAFHSFKDFNKLNNFDYIFVSPGIPKSKYSAISHSPSAITSNTQLFFDLIKELRSRIESGMTAIGVTGTKGKSTTTALIHHVLKENNLDSFLGGNIGIPPLDLLSPLIKEEKPDANQAEVFYVLELSSHQLANLKTSPNIAVIQTIKEEHLDHFENFEKYISAKANITKYQNEKDLLIYFADNKIVKEIAEKSKAKKIDFSENNFIDLAATKLKGKHNLINIMPSVIIGKKLGLSEKQIKKAIASFKGLPHRLEFVANINGAEYYNDSLGTNPHATIAALEAFKNKNIILIAGGYDRGLDYFQLAEKISKSKISKLILFPQTGKKIAENIRDKNYIFVQNMHEAVTKAYESAKSEDVVLLSPASASFGLFKDYADRGNQFKEEVLKLA